MERTEKISCLSNSIRSLFGVAAAVSIHILFNGSCQVGLREIGGVKSGEFLSHDFFNVGFLEHGAADGGAVAALIPRKVLDVEDRVGVGGRNDGFVSDCGGAEGAVLRRPRNRGLVLGGCARPCDLPWRFHVSRQGFQP